MDIQDITIHTLFEKHARLKPDTYAIMHNKKSLNYDELNKKANQLARYLLAKGLQPDTPIALCIERSFECLITMLAILKAGGGYLPIDASHPAERLLLILNDSNAPILITKSNLKEKFKDYQGTLILLDQIKQIIAQEDSNNLNLDVKPQQIAYVIYTSGSTGKPKGVLIEHRSAVNYCFWFTDYCSLKKKQKVDFSSNHTFDMAITLSIAPLVLGLTIVICDDEVKKNVRHYLKHLKSSKINLIKLTPSYFKILIQEVKNEFINLPYLKTIILGGENLTTADCKSWLKLYPKHVLYNEYGPTETTVGISQFKICKKNVSNLGTNVPIGQIGYNTNFIILDANHTPVTPGETGELHVGGICLARGYLNQPELTTKQFITDPQHGRLYKTGDLCRQREDGILEYFGRIDSQVKIRGFRIDPEEVEKHLASFATIDSAVVLAQKDPLNEDRLVAYFTLKGTDTPPNVTQLREHLQNHLPEYMIPTAFININSFPLTSNGKLDKSLLPNSHLTASQQHKKPLTVLEKKLAEIWSEELGVKDIGVDDDFFELGGHSLSAARIISKINRSLKKDIALHDFYHATSIAKLVDVINKKKKRNKKLLARKLELFNKLEDIPLCDFQFMLWISDTFESKAKKLNITCRKRLQGQLDIKALEFAFNAVLKKQEVLFYRILKFRPAQLLQKNLSFKITEINLKSLSEQDSEIELESSINQLIDFYPWPKESPLIIAKLFHLNNDEVELQICLPHIVSDDFSPQILLSELSQFYLLYNRQPDTKAIKADNNYKKYIFNEQYDMQQNIDRDTLFWRNYLKDASLFTISEKHIIKNMQSNNIAYSTYTQIPVSELNNLKQFCANHHISINDGLSAAVALALHRCSEIQEHKTTYTYMNIVKSTRNSDTYDETIGCFLRLEPVKIALEKSPTLSTIAKQIHQSTIETSMYQQCPNLIKLSSVSTFNQKRKIIKSFLVNVFTSLYAKIFSLPEINRKILKLCSDRLNSFQRTTHFLININIHKNFISEPHKNKTNLFGLDTTKINDHQYDLLKIDNMIDACFLRKEDGTPFLVISANLKSNFRELIAKETISILGASLVKIPQDNLAPVLNKENITV